MREYELTYLVSDEVLESDLNKVTGKVSGIISAVQGKIKKEEIWGRRKLAYPIRKQNFANYVTLWIELPADQVAGINHELQVMPQVLRHLLIIKSVSEEQLKVTKEDIVADEELEKVIGDKSVEIIAGETEESYDLMAKRDSGEEKAEEEQNTDDITEDKATQMKEEASVVEEPKKKSQAKTEEEKPAEQPKTSMTEKNEAEKKTKRAKTTKAKKTTEKPEKNEEDEADRIKKLDEKLDELLKDDL